MKLDLGSLTDEQKEIFYEIEALNNDELRAWMEKKEREYSEAKGCLHEIRTNAVKMRAEMSELLARKQASDAEFDSYLRDCERSKEINSEDEAQTKANLDSLAAYSEIFKVVEDEFPYPDLLLETQIFRDIRNDLDSMNANSEDWIKRRQLIRASSDAIATFLESTRGEGALLPPASQNLPADDAPAGGSVQAVALFSSIGQDAADRRPTAVPDYVQSMSASGGPAAMADGSIDTRDSIAADDALLLPAPPNISADAPPARATASSDIFNQGSSARRGGSH